MMKERMLGEVGRVRLGDGRRCGAAAEALYSARALAPRAPREHGMK